MKRRNGILLIALAAAGLGAAVWRDRFNDVINIMQALTQKRTVEDRLQEFGTAARARLQSHFTRTQTPYPPEAATLLVLKEERRLEVYAPVNGAPRFVCAYPILGASGGPGPKLREGDKQVPEGIYRIELLNPNSLHHVSLRIGYPNEFDRAEAAREGRTDLGRDIMIHGGSGSVGCVAVGDPVSEEIFTLAVDMGFEKITVVSAPRDFRAHGVSAPVAGQPAWVPELYAQIQSRLATLPRPANP